jgi:pimeloyl-ACP methyl ester carboxylesterase
VEPQTERALLAKGFHVAFIDVSNLYGSPKAVSLWNKLYAKLVKDFHLSKKPVLEGFSRGGLIVYNWAKLNPEKVSCIYADAPVCDIKSWPAGKGSYKGSEENWRLCGKAYNMTEEELLAYNGNPIDNLEPLAEAGIRLLHICGDADSVVPMRENTDILLKRYRELGGDIKLIVKKGCEHHPHSLKDPTPIVEFILKNTEPFCE